METYTIDAMKRHGHKISFLHLIDNESVFISCPYSPSTEIKLNNPAKFDEIFYNNLKNRRWSDDEINVVRRYIFAGEWLDFVTLDSLMDDQLRVL